MMSLFSSFEALCGESYGYNFKFTSEVPNPKADSSSVSSSVVRSVEKDGKDNSKSNTSNSDHNRNSSSPSPPSHVSQVQKQRRPRFAPELDGVNCFETIIPF